MTDHVLDNGPALKLLLDLEQRGVAIELDGDDVLLGPQSALTAADVAAVRRHKATFVQLVGIADERVQERLEAFKNQKPSTAPVLMGGFRYVAGVCFSCGERVPDRRRWGRCWRCALALRLAWNCPVPPIPEEVAVPEAPQPERERVADGQMAVTHSLVNFKESTS